MREEDLFARALELPPEERSDFIRRESGEDEALRKGVEKLLDLCESDLTILDHPCEEFEFLRRTAPGSAPSSPSDSVEPVDTPPEHLPHLSDNEAAAQHDDQQPIPRTIGRYEIKEVLGKGSFGIVLRGSDASLSRDVAIKIPHASHVNLQGDVETFLQEARRIARLRHPGIVSIHDVGVHEGNCFIVSDFLEGGDLSRWLKTNRPSWRKTAEIAIQIAEALAYAHANSTVHRDVKPANIIMTEGDQPVLVDFGLALSDAEPVVVDRRVAGTPAYMSPEQARGAGHRIDGRTDIYSLGVILYEMLARRRPFRAQNTLELLRMVIEDEPQPPRQLVSGIPRQLETVCLKAMAKHIADRYTTAGDLAGDLRALLAPGAESAQEVMAEPEPDSAEEFSGQQSVSLGPEHRQITCLLIGCDFFSSGEYLEKLEPEDQAGLLKAYRELCEAVIADSVGSIVQMDEEKVLVSFGYPLAFEDATRRAVLTALAFLRSVENLRRTGKFPSGMELGPWAVVHTGNVVAETTADGSLSMVGEGRTVITRLGSVAEPNRVLITGEVHRLCKRFFDFDAAGTRQLKGFARQFETFLVVKEREVRGQFEAGESGLTPLIGRDREVGLLQDRWVQTQEGMGQVVTIIGEAGLGKSRLIHTIREYVSQDEGGAEPRIVEWLCSPLHQNSGLHAAISFFEALLGIHRDEIPGQRLDKLAAHLGKLNLANDEQLALFSDLLSIPSDGRFAELQLTPAKLREKTLAALGDWFSAFSRERPVLFIVEDLHWVDPTTLEFLKMHVDQGLNSSILTLLTFRPDFETPWKSLAHQTVVALNRLTKQQVKEMVKGITGVEDLPGDLVLKLADRTDGVPLFVEEFALLMEETGTLGSSGRDSSSSSSLTSHEIPSTLQDLLLARLDRIAANKEVAQLGAVLGRRFSYEFIRAVSELDEESLQSELDKLVRADLLIRNGSYPEAELVFKHALLEDAAYNSLLKQQRREYHKRIADTLTRQFVETAERQPELVALHYAEGNCPELAVEYYLKAGLRSREHSADVEAIEHLSRGLELLERIEAGSERDRLELQFQVPLSTAYIVTRGYAAPEAESVLIRARELCEKVGDPVQIFSVMWGRWAWLIVRGDHAQCMDVATDAMGWAHENGDLAGVQMEANFMQGASMYYQADHAGARGLFEEAIERFEDRELTKQWSFRTGQNCSVTVRSYLAFAVWHLGDPAKAIEISGETVRIARELSHPFSLCYVLIHAAMLHQYCGHGEQAEALGAETVAVAKEQGFTFFEAWATICRGTGLLELDRKEEALEMIRKGLQDFRATGAELALTRYLSVLGDAYGRCGQLDEALESLDEAIAVADKNEEFCEYAELHRQKGYWLLQQSDDHRDLARSLFEKAIEIARRQGSVAWELKATTSLGRLLQGGDQQAGARSQLQQLCGRYPSALDTSDLRDARSLLSDLA